MKENKKHYLLFEELIKERDNIMLSSLLNPNVDLTRLREIATQLYECDPEFYPINVSGSDAELWQSVRDYLKQYEP